MPTIEFMRNCVMEMYKGEAWARKVRNMSDSQVVAIYMREQKRREKKNEKHPPQETEPF